MFETLKLINEFYKNEVGSGQYLHKLLTYCYYFSFEFLSLIFGRNFIKLIFRNYIKIDFIKMKIKLKDGLIINHFLGSIGQIVLIFIIDEYDLKKIKNNVVVLDLGANLGFVSIMLAKRKNAILYSFEPEPRNYEMLLKNKIENKLDKIYTYRLAVSDKKDKIKLYLHGSSTHSILPQRKKNKFVIVKSDTLDNICNNVKNIDLIKIDVEGSECKIIKGAKKTLSKCEKIIVEYQNKDNKNETIRLLNEYNYHVKHLIEKHKLCIATRNN